MLIYLLWIFSGFLAQASDVSQLMERYEAAVEGARVQLLQSTERRETPKRDEWEKSFHEAVQSTSEFHLKALRASQRARIEASRSESQKRSVLDLEVVRK